MQFLVRPCLDCGAGFEVARKSENSSQLNTICERCRAITHNARGQSGLPLHPIEYVACILGRTCLG